MSKVLAELMSLDTVVDALRTSLQAMAAKLEQAPPKDGEVAFDVLDVEIELQVVASTASKAGGVAEGDVELKVLGFGGGNVAGKITGEHAWTNATTQKVRLKRPAKATTSADVVSVGREG